MNRFFWSFTLLVSFPAHIFAGVYLGELLPNPAGDDTIGEYIDIRNTGCSEVDIGGYELRDLQKAYTFPSPTFISSKSTMRFAYATTKISLNNSGLETITLKNSGWGIVDSYSYSGAQQDNIVLMIPHADDDCTPPAPIESTGAEIPPPMEEGSTWSGVIDPIIESTWVTLPDGTWSTSSWVTLILTWSDMGSWTIQTESSGSTAATWWVTPPEIPPIPEIGTWTGTTPEPNTWTRVDEHSSSWGLEEEGIISTETGILVATEMYYSDEDANNRIDTLEIVYPYMLTWTVNTWAIFLYSRSGGLSVERINTLTGYILSGSLSGNTLLLTIREWDLEKLELHITDSTTSDLRLKSLWDLGFRSMWWLMPESFYLTSSFENYTNVIYKEYYYEEEESSWDNTESPSNTWEEEALIHFPEIFPTLQSPTNASYFSGEFLCDTSPCRINMTFTHMFSSGFSLHDYTCHFGTGELLSIDTDCNPDTYYFTSSWNIVLDLLSRIDPSQKVSQSFSVSWAIQDESEGTPLGRIDANPPVIVLEHDGKWHTYYHEISPYEFECYTMTCAINMTAEHSYDPEWWSLRYMWMYDGWGLIEKKDPGEKRFGLGEHRIWLRVFDQSENMSEVYFTLSVLGEEEKDIANSPKEKNPKKSSKVKESSKKKSSKKVKEVAFFDPPEILLQSTDSASKRYEGYTCYTTTKTCSFNFALASTIQDIVYTWEYNHGEKLITKNPKSLSLTPGKHEVVLTASYDWVTPLWSKTLNLSVEATKIAKKKKVTVKKTVVPKPKKEPSAAKVISAFEMPEENPHFPIESLYLIGGIGGSYLIRRKFFQS